MRGATAATGLLRLTTGLRLATDAGRATRALGSAQVQLSGESCRVLVILDARDHGMRATCLVLVDGLVLDARRCRLRVSMAVSVWLARGAFFLGGQRGDACGLGLGASGFFADTQLFGELGGAELVGFGQALLLGQVALLGFLQLAQDLGMLIRRRRATAEFGRLDQRHLLAHEHVDRGAVLAATDGQFLLAAAIERDLLRRSFILGRLVSLAVGAPQEAEQLHLFRAGDDLVGTFKAHSGLGQLLQKFLDRCVHQFGQLADRGLLRHADFVSCGAGSCPRVGIASDDSSPGIRVAWQPQPSRSSRAISSARALRINAAARSSSMPSMPNSTNSSAASSPRSSTVRMPWPASAKAVSSSMPSSDSRSSAGWCSSTSSSTASASFNNASRARARSSSTMSSSKPSTASSSPTGTEAISSTVLKPSETRMPAISSSTSSLSMNSWRAAICSASLLACTWSAVITLSCQPVRRLARRTFWPPLPIAWARRSSATARSIECFSSSTTMDCTSAGAIALMTNCAGLSLHRMMSTRSPLSSLDTACTREPRMPMQAPIGSVRWSCASTAILARSPGSRAQALISTRPCPTSGTSSLNSSIMNSGAVRLMNSCGPRC